jgi:LPXTG-motif cell wall-anchored protein
VLLALILAIFMVGAGSALASGNDHAAAAAPNGQGASSSSQATADDEATSSGSTDQVSPEGESSSPSQGDAHRSAQAKVATGSHDTSSPEVSSSAQNTTASDHQTEGTAGTAGTPPAEQPNSTADDNESGANGQCSDDDAGDTGPYCGTARDHESLNGNGNGEAVGKPCAGCVGKADNKNPPGQMPNAAEDRNSGYECDTNNGIGKTNPAHTGCVSGTETPGEECVPSKANNNCGAGEECVPSEADNQCGQGEECVPSEANNDCVEGEGHVTPPPTTTTPPNGGEVTPPKENHVTPPKSPTVKPAEVNRPPVVAGVETVAQPPGAVQQTVTPPTAVQPSSGVLPNTGTPAFVGLAALLGLAFLGLGAVAMRSRRGTES